MSLKISNFHKKYFSELAFKLAEINKYKTAENPSVGCVVTNYNNDIISKGFTSIGGRPHAETNALKNISSRIIKRMFVTLEPCCHFGKTPPCTRIIKKKNIKNIYIYNKDPNFLVNGKGISFLKRNKINCTIKINNNHFYEQYNYSVKSKFPFVTSKLAITNKYNTVVNTKKYFTSEQALKFAHLLRYQNDSILVGKNTFLKDMPKLNCRIDGLEKFSPKIFIINKDLDFNKKNLTNTSKKIFVIHSCQNQNKVLRFSKIFNLIKLKNINGLIDPKDILMKIYQLGLRRLLIEGGVKTLNLFQKQKLINKFIFIKSCENISNTRNSAKFLIDSASSKNLNKYRVNINLSNNELFII